jgi:hypothetical protein
LCFKILFSNHCQSAQHFCEKRKGAGSGARSGSVTNGSGCGSRRPKNIREYGSGILDVRVTKLGRQSCRVACLLMGIYGGDWSKFGNAKTTSLIQVLNFLRLQTTAVIFHSGVAFGIGLCEIMGTVFACLLAKKFNSKFDRMV